MNESSVGSNPTPSAIFFYEAGEMTESAEGARLLSECGDKTPPRVRIPLSPPILTYTSDVTEIKQVADQTVPQTGTI